MHTHDPHRLDGRYNALHATHWYFRRVRTTPIRRAHARTDVCMEWIAPTKSFATPRNERAQRNRRQIRNTRVRATGSHHADNAECISLSVHHPHAAESDRSKWRWTVPTETTQTPFDASTDSRGDAICFLIIQSAGLSRYGSRSSRWDAIPTSCERTSSWDYHPSLRCILLNPPCPTRDITGNRSTPPRPPMR
jgi:hypothetical protein